MFLPIGLAVDSMFILTLARGGNLDFSTPEVSSLHHHPSFQLISQLFFSYIDFFFSFANFFLVPHRGF